MEIDWPILVIVLLFFIPGIGLLWWVLGFKVALGITLLLCAISIKRNHD